ncbi:hypothetical protein [Brucella anthropi]|uniref:hypothetical protein n=1 Tax=Brucella anthropi TaxID=529 RepID=UPI00384EFC99
MSELSNTLSSLNAGQKPSSVGDIQTILAQKMRDHDAYIIGELDDALQLKGPLMSRPRYISEQFQKWSLQIDNPEQLALLRLVQRKMDTMHKNNRDFIKKKIQSNIQKVQLELSLKAMSKTTAGLQQLLSSQ